MTRKVLAAATGVALVAGLWAAIASPPDAFQGDFVRIMYVHVLDVSTDKAVADFYRSARLIERLLIQTFERESEWQASPWRSGTEELT